MPGNKWVEHVKEFSKRTGKTYGCAISDPECKASYVKTPAKARAPKKPKAPKKMTKKEKQDEEFFKKFIDM
jgi:hypothetical protein